MEVTRRSNLDNLYSTAQDGTHTRLTDSESKMHEI